MKNVRAGFLHHAEYKILLGELPEEIKPLFVVGITAAAM